MPIKNVTEPPVGQHDKKIIRALCNRPSHSRARCVVFRRVGACTPSKRVYTTSIADTMFALCDMTAKKLPTYVIFVAATVEESNLAIDIATTKYDDTVLAVMRTTLNSKCWGPLPFLTARQPLRLIDSKQVY